LCHTQLNLLVHDGIIALYCLLNVSAFTIDTLGSGRKICILLACEMAGANPGFEIGNPRNVACISYFAQPTSDVNANDGAATTTTTDGSSSTTTSTTTLAFVTATSATREGEVTPGDDSMPLNSNNHNVNANDGAATAITDGSSSTTTSTTTLAFVTATSSIFNIMIDENIQSISDNMNGENVQSINSNAPNDDDDTSDQEQTVNANDGAATATTDGSSSTTTSTTTSTTSLAFVTATSSIFNIMIDENIQSNSDNMNGENVQSINSNAPNDDDDTSDQEQTVIDNWRSSHPANEDTLIDDKIDNVEFDDFLEDTIAFTEEVTNRMNSIYTTSVSINDMANVFVIVIFFIILHSYILLFQ
jgi:hypothetical protein